MADNPIDYQSQLLLLGSCFVENIGGKLAYYKFKSLQNPFGILFHPIAIENLLSKSIQEINYTEDDIFYHNERWHCFDAHSDLSDVSKEELLRKLNGGLKEIRKKITASSHIVITLGTAWVYQELKSNTIVANCHKVPQKEFSKDLLSVDKVSDSLMNTIRMIRTINPSVHFIFTVSPVRHLKDGFVENQLSKAHLLAAVNKVIQNSNFLLHTSYFPSYEIMMDELRDYRFYARDMVHPNQLGIDYIWERFKDTWITRESHETMSKVEAVQKGLEHKSFNPESEAHQGFLKSLQTKITYLQQRYPFMEFNT